MGIRGHPTARVFNGVMEGVTSCSSKVSSLCCLNVCYKGTGVCLSSKWRARVRGYILRRNLACELLFFETGERSVLGELIC